jgi:hypothetical protein
LTSFGKSDIHVPWGAREAAPVSPEILEIAPSHFARGF